MSVLDIFSVVDKFIQDGHQFTCFDVTREVRNRGESVKHSTTREIVHGLNGDNLPPFRDSGYSRNTVSFVTKGGHSDTAEVYRLDSDNRAYDPDRNFDSPVSSNDTVDSDDSDNSDDDNDAPVASVPPQLMPKNPADIVLDDITYPCPVCSHVRCRSEFSRMIRSNSISGVVIYTDGTNSLQSQTTTGTVKSVTTQSKTFNKVDKRGRICVRNDLVRQLGVKRGDRVYLQKNGGDSIVITTTVPPTADYIGSLKVDRDDNIRVSRSKQQKAGITAVQFSMTKDGNRLVLSA